MVSQIILDSSFTVHDKSVLFYFAQTNSISDAVCIQIASRRSKGVRIEVHQSEESEVS